MTIPANAQAATATWGAIPVIICWGTEGGPYNVLDTATPLPAGGNVASGVTDAGNPIKIGGKALAAFPANVTTGQRVDALFNRGGMLCVSPISDTALGDTTNGAASYVDVGGNYRVGSSVNMMWDGTQYNRQRANLDATALSSSARTVQTSSSDITNYNGGAIIVYLNVTVASGTGGLTVRIQGKDPVSGNYFNLNAAPTAVTATGQTAYVLGPGNATASGDVVQATQGRIPRTFRITVTVGDASSYTYSIGYSTIQN